MTRADDATLRKALSSRHAEAIEELCRRNGDTLYRVALIVCQDSALAEAAVSGAFRALWEDPELGSEESGLYEALVRATCSRCGQGDQAAAPPFDIVPRPHRDLLALTLVAGYTHRQAARCAGVDEDAGAPLLSAALRTVRAAQVLAKGAEGTTRGSPSFGTPTY